MATPYFRYVPNFEYVNRLRDNKTISAYIQTKNLFRRGVLREDIFTDLSYFTKYSIVGDERPDNVAYEYYYGLFNESPNHTKIPSQQKLFLPQI